MSGSYTIEWTKGAIMNPIHAAQYINGVANKIMQETPSDFELPAWFVLFLDSNLEPITCAALSGDFDPDVLSPMSSSEVSRIAMFRVFPDGPLNPYTADDFTAAIGAGLLCAATDTRLCVYATNLEGLTNVTDEGFVCEDLMDRAMGSLIDYARHCVNSPDLIVGTMEGTQYVN